MGKLSSKVIRDIVYFSIGSFIFQLFSVPTAIMNGSLSARQLVQAVVLTLAFLIGWLISELLTTFIWNLPADYTQEDAYQKKRAWVFFGQSIILCTLTLFLTAVFFFLGFQNPQIAFDEQHLQQSVFLLVNMLYQNILLALIYYFYWRYITMVRIQKLKIEELTILNTMIESRQENKKETEEDIEYDTIKLDGDRNDSIEIKPNEIVCVESVANYVDVVHFSGNKICQQRLRGSLKMIEQQLEEYTFIVHCHRAFLVNINYVNQMDGNANGYKLQLMGLEKTVPVSRGNIELLKERLGER